MTTPRSDGTSISPDLLAPLKHASRKTVIDWLGNDPKLAYKSSNLYPVFTLVPIPSTGSRYESLVDSSGTPWCFLPEQLPKLFTTKDFQKVTKISQSYATTGLHILHHMGIIERVGKQGRAYLYQIKNNDMEAF